MRISRLAVWALTAAVATMLFATAAPAAPRSGVYVGTTQSGQTVRFLVLRSGTRVGDMSFGSLPAGCERFEAWTAGFSRVRRHGRFRAFFELPQGSEFISVSGRLLPGGRARGRVGAVSRTPCVTGGELWTARRAHLPLLGGRLDGRPSLAGPGAVWGERRGRSLLLRLGAAGRRTRTVLRMSPGGQGLLSLRGSGYGLAFDVDERPYAGRLGGPFSRLSACGVAAPDVDGPLLLYDRPQDACGSRDELRLRNLATGADSLLTRTSQFDEVGALRLAGDYVAIAIEDSVYVFRRSALDGRPFDRALALYSVPRGQGDFDLQRDGKLAVTSFHDAVRCGSCWRVDWYSPAQPRRHGVDPLVARRPEVELEADRVAVVTGDGPDRGVTVATLDAQSARLAIASRGRTVRSRVLGFDFDGTRVVIATRTARRRHGRWAVGRVRIEILPLQTAHD